MAHDAGHTADDDDVAEHVATLLGRLLEEGKEGNGGKVDGGDVAEGRVRPAMYMLGSERHDSKAREEVRKQDVRVVCLSPLLEGLAFPKRLLQLVGVLGVWFCFGAGDATCRHCVCCLALESPDAHSDVTYRACRRDLPSLQSLLRGLRGRSSW